MSHSPEIPNLPPRLLPRVELLIELAEERSGRIAEAVSAAGGSINAAWALRMEDGRRYMLKANDAPLPLMFECEAEGLAALAAAARLGPAETALRIPRPLGAAEPKGPEKPGGPAPGFIVMEYIPPGRAWQSGGATQRAFMRRLGAGLAQLHRDSAAARPAFGFGHDNYIGATPQPNAQTTDWVAFWREHRLGHQLRLADEAGLADRELLRLGEALLGRLDALIGEPDEPACLLHGDLWGGNYLADADGTPVLIDPAAYYGRREADLAMTYLFGGFTPDFYAAYEEAWPLAPGSAERLEVYKLYHMLNHLNLFGPGYHAACMAILQRLR